MTKAKSKERSTTKKLSPCKIAKQIGLPTKEWIGNCHYVANQLLKHGIIKGELRYGHWHGEISDQSRFGGRRFTHHGWIELSDGNICDPTRWVFEHAKPYIYVGPNNGEYDFGGNKLRKMLMRPCPPFDSSVSKDKIYDYSHLSEGAKSIVSMLTLSVGLISINQLFWLANCPLDFFDEWAKEIYQWIIDIKFGSFIPFDNRQFVMSHG
jgi:hypothetical protein